jgi:hypothetical protein
MGNHPRNKVETRAGPRGADLNQAGVACLYPLRGGFGEVQLPLASGTSLNNLDDLEVRQIR